MVLFENVKIGQRVEVRWKGRIITGTVKYKGPLNGVRGEWVGVAFDFPVGNHDGMIKGRRYFLCDPKHGIFTLATQIRFISLKRCLYDTYHRVEEDEEEDLFGTSRPVENKNSFIVEGHAERICDLNGYKATAERNPNSLRHSISSIKPAVTMLRPRTSNSSVRRSDIYENDYNDFVRASSIPQIHMPHAALKRQVQLGWARAPLVRYWSVHNGRDAIKRTQWNDVS